MWDPLGLEHGKPNALEPNGDRVCCANVVPSAAERCSGHPPPLAEEVSEKGAFFENS